MKTFPYRILFLCLFLPPVCYILTLQGLEGYLRERATIQINNRLIQNDQALYRGLLTVREEIHRNIISYLSGNLLLRTGVRLNILVKTGDNRILYPAHHEQGLSSDTYADQDDRGFNAFEIARENYDLLSSGLILSVELKIPHNSWLSNSILVLYIFIAVYVLQLFVRKNIRESEKTELEQRHVIQKLSAELNQAETTLEQVKVKEVEYEDEVDRLDRDKDDLNKDIEGLLEEMELLEKGLNSQRELREHTEEKVSQLTAELEQLKGRFKKDKKKSGKTNLIDKRFKVLYKNLYLSERALSGFSSLTDDFQLKAEEIIHKLNEDDSLVNVKRKVFSKGGKINVLEVDFSYSGRLYYRKENSGKIVVLAIGTKNTQDQDLQYLENEEGRRASEE